jgi:hypothetical protein
MNTFESHLLNGIPQNEAAEYFLRIRGRDKLAVDAVAFEAAIADLPEAERNDLLKQANMMAPGGGSAALPQTAKGMNMAPPTPTPLPPTAMGQQPMKMASDKSPDDVGKERGRASVAAEFEKEKHHSGENSGSLMGRLGGAALGGGAMHRYGHGNPLATLGGVALGAHMGGQVGKSLGAHQDRKNFEKGAAAFKLALDSMGMTDSGMAPQMAQQPAPQAKQTATGVTPSPEAQIPQEMQSPQQGEQGGIEAQIPPAVQQYLQAQQAGDQAAEQGHADFLRQKLDEAHAAQQAAEESAAGLQEAQAMHEQEQAQVQQQVQESIQQASQAQDQVLQEQQAAAAMRMAYQQLRGQVLQIVSSDPPSLSSDAAAMSAAASASSAPAPQAGPAGQAPNPGVSGGNVAPEGDATVSAPTTPNEPMMANAQPASQTGTKEPTGDAKTPGKEVLSHYLPLHLRSLLQ